MTIFWTLPPQFLSPSARPVGIAFLNSCGMIAAASSPLLVGFFRDLTNSWKAGLGFVAVMMLVSAVLVFAVLFREHLPKPADSAQTRRV